MQLYHYDKEGNFTGSTFAQKLPNSENYIIPFGSTPQIPLVATEGFECKFINGSWELVAIDIVSEQAKIKKALIDAIQVHLDTTAQQRNYYTVDSAAKYIGGINAQWSAEGIALRDWTTNVWEYCYGVLAECLAGTRQIPTPEVLISELPEIVWP